MTEERYIYASVGIGYEILDSWLGYIGDEAPTEREIEEYDYLVIGLAPDQDSADGICRRLNDQQDEIDRLFNFSIRVIVDEMSKKNEHLKKSVKRQQDSNNECAKLIKEQQKENEQLKKENKKLICIIKQLEAKYEDKGFSLAYDMEECE